MKKFIITLLMLPIIAFADSESEVNKTISHMLQLLENNKIEEFLNQSIHPEELQKAKLTIDQKLIEKFSKKKKDKVIGLLKEIIKQEAFSKNTQKVTYKMGMNQYINFLKYEERWYLSNNDNKPKD